MLRIADEQEQAARLHPQKARAELEGTKTVTTFTKEGHMRLAKYRFLVVPLFFVFACFAALAQQNSEVIGTITDPTGAAVAGAKLTP